MPRVQSSNARWASSSGTAIDTGARFGQLSSGSAVQRGSRDRPQLTFTTGLVVRQPATRAANAASIGVAEQPGRRDLGVGVGDDGAGADHLAALEHDALARADLGDGDARRPAAAPASRAASAMANEIRPIPPST